MINPEVFSCPIIFILQICKSVGWHLHHIFLYTFGRKTVIWLAGIQVENQPGPPCPSLWSKVHDLLVLVAPSGDPIFIRLGKVGSWGFLASEIQLYRKGKATIETLTTKEEKKNPPLYAYAKLFFNWQKVCFSHEILIETY